MLGLRDCTQAVSSCGKSELLLVAVQGFSLRSTGSRLVLSLWSTGSVVVAHGLSFSMVCGILLVQGTNLCLLQWQADSYPFYHQGRP